MSKAVSIAKEQVYTAVQAAMKKAMAAGMLPEAELPAFTVERPADRTHGDFATNAAMVSARTFRMAPPKIAAAILGNLELSGTYFTKAETAGPGFMNFFLSPAFYSDVLRDVLTADTQYGRSDFGKKRKVMVEFVSANPTGPMHMGNARGGALGDCLSAVLDAAGYDVWREFYVNDAGNQLEKFGLSLSIRYQQLFAENPPELPEDSYHGEDILDLAKEYAAANGDSLMQVSEEERRNALVGFGLPKNIAKMKADMEKYRVHYDRWFLESDLHKSGEVMAVVDYLRDRGLTYEKDGAVWYKNAEVVAKRLRAEGKSEKQIEALELKDD
ncbi:MAG: arginine--tRNA ligase, partial [Hominenteromicrobium sp.]